MTDIPVPGFGAYLRRTYGQGVLDFDREVVQTVGVDVGVTTGDETVVEVKGSSNIKSLRYNRKLKRLTTMFVSGSFHAYGDVTPEEFEAVIHPGAEYGHSVGKAHHAIIRSKKG